MNTPEELVKAKEYADKNGVNPRIHNQNGTLCSFTDKCRNCGLKSICATYDDIREHTIKFGTDAQFEFLFEGKKPKTCQVIPINKKTDMQELAISA